MSEIHKAEGAKPCPFCGSTEIYAEPYEHAAGTRWRILCAECMGQVDTGTFRTEGRALEAWNRRTPPKTVQPDKLATGHADAQTMQPLLRMGV